MKTIAICFNIPELDAGGYMDPAICNKYPGSGWMPHLVELGRNAGYFVTSGGQALYSLSSGVVDPKEIYVIQEEENGNGQHLIRLGAHGAALTCLESPIFTPRFYDRIELLTKKFRNHIFFSEGTERLYFPTFEETDLKSPEPWGTRDFMCAVVANKHYRMMRGYEDSPSWQYALKDQLHDFRFNSIGYWYHRPGFKLYGKGWGQLADPVDDKLSTIRNYKFALCFENGRYPGYVTEKVIDCLVAGVIPIYCGAPNIWDYVPDTAILEVGPDCHWEMFEKFLRDFPEEKAERMIKAGQEWLRGEGMRHSNRAFARKILECVGG